MFNIMIMKIKHIQLVDIGCFNMLFNALINTFDLSNIQNNRIHKNSTCKKVELGTRKICLY